MWQGLWARPVSCLGVWFPTADEGLTLWSPKASSATSVGPGDLCLLPRVRAGEGSAQVGGLIPSHQLGCPVRRVSARGPLRAPGGGLTGRWAACGCVRGRVAFRREPGTGGVVGICGAQRSLGP